MKKITRQLQHGRVRRHQKCVFCGLVQWLRGQNCAAVLLLAGHAVFAAGGGGRRTIVRFRSEGHGGFCGNTGGARASDARDKRRFQD